jgi:hypothetical protein
VAKYYKKPIVVDAIQFHWGPEDWTSWGVCFCFVGNTFGGVDHPHIHTLEGVMSISAGDWIIKGVKGETYPCKPDIFALTYEPADPEPSDPNS